MPYAGTITASVDSKEGQPLYCGFTFGAAPMKKMKPEARKAQVVATALALAEKSHYLQVTRVQVAEALDITPQSVRHYFSTMPQMRGDMVRTAIKTSNLVVIAQAVTAKDPRALKVSKEVIREAMEALLNE
jgi:AcrR family transcriptional regulator